MDDREQQKRADNGSVNLQLILEDMTEEEKEKLYVNKILPRDKRSINEIADDS